MVPVEGQFVIVEGGIAQYRDGVFYTGMEEPRYTRPIQWAVAWWLPLAGSVGDPRDALIKTLLYELRDLLAMVEGECPSLLEDHHQWVTVTEAIKKGELWMKSLASTTAK